MGKRFDFGELNPNFAARTGQTIDPQRFTTNHIQQKLIEKYIRPDGFKTVQGPLKGIVIRQEGTTRKGDFLGEYHGLMGIEQEPRVKIRVRIPELHPFPDPHTYGNEGPDGIISLYPVFVAIDSTLKMPAVGEIVYVDYGDRDNLEDPRYYGQLFIKPILGGSSQVGKNSNGPGQGIVDRAKNLFGGAASSLKDWMSPPTSNNDIPTILSPNSTQSTDGIEDESIEQSIEGEEFRQIFSIHPVSSNFRITSKFGTRTDPTTGRGRSNHNGIDYGCPRNTPAVSIGKGIVSLSNNDPNNSSGKYVVINGVDEFEGFSWSYSHLETINVRAGTKIEVGQQIGKTGKTGVKSNGEPSATGPHLHFVVMKKNEGSIDPLPLLPKREA